MTDTEVSPDFKNTGTAEKLKDNCNNHNGNATLPPLGADDIPIRNSNDNSNKNNIQLEPLVNNNNENKKYNNNDSITNDNNEHDIPVPENFLGYNTQELAAKEEELEKLLETCDDDDNDNDNNDNNIGNVNVAEDFNIGETGSSGNKKKIKWPIPLECDEKLWKNLSSSVDLLEILEREQQIKVRTITWNMHAKAGPSFEELNEKLIPKNKYHIYAVGTQECEHTIAQSVVNQSKKNWETSLRRAIGAKYEMLWSHSLQASHLIVFVHRALVPYLTNVSALAVPTGIKNKLGNKGGIGVTLTLGKTKMLFVTSHFAAGQKATELRNLHFARISSSLAKTLGQKSTSGDSNRNLLDIFDRVFWFGDLNYRINADRTLADRLIQNKMHDVLYSNDQLNVEKENKEVFIGYSEGPLHFKPTYKFDENSNIYDTSKKQRIPSWTDRILYKQEGTKILAYNSAADIKTSDHKAVYAAFDVKVDVHIQHDETEENTATNTHISQVCTIS